MTVDDYIINTYYKNKIKLWIFDPLSLKWFNNQNNKNYITCKIYDEID